MQLNGCNSQQQQKVVLLGHPAHPAVPCQRQTHKTGRIGDKIKTARHDVGAHVTMQFATQPSQGATPRPTITDYNSPISFQPRISLSLHCLACTPEPLITSSRPADQQVPSHNIYTIRTSPWIINESVIGSLVSNLFWLHPTSWAEAERWKDLFDWKALRPTLRWNIAHAFVISCDTNL